ncbi:MAG: RtcB family protein [Mangrovibacterium sp.]
MKQVVSEGCNVPTRIWLEDLESNALSQARNLSNLPFVFKHVALMPDCHSGYGMPIGGVLATKGVVIPNTVGVDIGCRMCAVKTSLTETDIDTIKKIMSGIRKLVPLGFDHQKQRQDEALMPSMPEEVPENAVVRHQYTAALKQIGTLGGGNHFIEIQKGSDGHVWIIIHSGSRNLGYKVAEHYNRITQKLNELWFSTIDKK